MSASCLMTQFLIMKTTTTTTATATTTKNVCVTRSCSEHALNMLKG